MGQALSRFDDDLRKLARFVEESESTERGLARLAELVSHAMDCRHCSIMLIKHDPDNGEPKLRVQAHHGDLPEAAYTEAQGLGSGIAGQVASSGKPLLISDLPDSEYAPLAKRPEAKGPDSISVPIVLEDEVVGVINVDSPEGARRLGEDDLRMASILALVVAKSLHIQRLRGLLKTHFIKLALARARSEGNGPVTHAPDKVAKLMARTLYQEMDKAGFSRDHILTAATEIIGQVSEAMEAR